MIIFKNLNLYCKDTTTSSIFWNRYRLTSNGPDELEVFTRPDFFRLTNFHVFHHRGQKILAAIGFPNFIFIADGENMSFIKKIAVNHPIKTNTACGVGTISPSVDGEKIYVQTTKSFQVVDISSGKSEMIIDHAYNHSCANHMLTSRDTNW